MLSTRPAANHIPHCVQYTPNASSIEVNVLALVNPSISSFALLATATIRNLNFQRSRPAGPSAASHFQWPLGCCSRSPSLVRDSSATRAAIVAYWREPCGRRSSEARHAINSAVVS
jgi:hypothetical protein